MTVWTLRPQWIDRSDAFVIESYKNYYKVCHYKAINELQERPFEAIPGLVSFTQSLDGAKKGDRLAQMKKVALLQLINAYHQNFTDL